MYCYAENGRSSEPCHLWLTGCKGEMGTQLRRLPGFDNWSVEREDRSYIEALEGEKENLVYLTADSENVVDELDRSKIYIIGGLVDRNRWKGITMKKAEEQGIQTAKLPIGKYLNMCSSQVLIRFQSTSWIGLSRIVRVNILHCACLLMIAGPDCESSG